MEHLVNFKNKQLVSMFDCFIGYLLFRYWHEPSMSNSTFKKEPPRIRTTSFADPAGRDTRPPQVGGGVRISRKCFL